MSSVVKSADRVLLILDFLASRTSPVPSMAIARQCSMPRSSTYHLLNVLLQRGYVRYYPEQRKWGLGRSVLELAPAYERTLPVASLGRPILLDLAAEVGGATRLLRLSGASLTVLVSLRPRAAGIVAGDDAAPAAPLYLSAPGRALLGALNPEPAERLWNARATVVEGASGRPVLASTVREILASDSVRGWSRELAAEHGGAEVAAPVTDDFGRVVAVVSARLAPGASWGDIEEAERATPAAAARLAAAIGGPAEESSAPERLSLAC